MLAHILGLDVPPSSWYDFWSGVGSDLGELAIVAVVYHHLNCHDAGCWRVARHRLGGFCRKHARRP
jgi:hypothetical protein